MELEVEQVRERLELDPCDLSETRKYLHHHVLIVEFPGEFDSSRTLPLCDCSCCESDSIWVLLLSSCDILVRDVVQDCTTCRILRLSCWTRVFSSHSYSLVDFHVSAFV